MHHGKLLTIPCFVILFDVRSYPILQERMPETRSFAPSLSYVKPSSDARLGGTGSDFLDPSNPSMVRFDVTEITALQRTATSGSDSISTSS